MSVRRERMDMDASREPGASIAISAVPNLRDLGGWPTKGGGRVRWGLVYRSTALDRLEGADMATFAALGIRSVYDLRTEGERAAQPDCLPPGTEYVVLDVIKDSAVAAPAKLLDVRSDPKAAEEMLGGGKGEPLFENGYREIVSLPSACAAYHRLFMELTQDEHRPALFPLHDRQGPHGLGGGVPAAVARRPGRPCDARVPADEQAAPACREAGPRPLPGPRRRPRHAALGGRCGAGVP